MTPARKHATGSEEQEERPSDKVTMSHPDVEGTATTTRRAFEKVWESRGWTLEAEKSPVAAPAAKDDESKQ
jgi:hypothetical protein